MTRFLSRIFARKTAARRGPAPRVVIYSRAGCHLCDDAIATARLVLASYGSEPTIVDVDTDQALAARYGELVPVVTVAGKQIARYTLSARQLRRALEAPRGS